MTNHAAEAAALIALSRMNVPPDVQDLLVAGDPMRGIPPGALRAAISAATTLPPGAEGELVERAKAAIDLGERMSARGCHPTNIYNVADDLLTQLVQKMHEFEAAESSLAEAQLRIAGLEDESAGRLRLANDCAVAAASAEERAAKVEEALREIAAFHDVAASKYLVDTGSYGAFDEPGSVEIARRALSDT